MSIWSIARTASNSEAKITERLALLGAPSYCPNYRELIVDHKSQRRRLVTRRLYPCYLFVREHAFRLLDVDGIVRVLLSQCGLIDDKVDELRRSEDSDGFVPRPVAEKHRLVDVRDAVVIMRGPFKGNSGVCSSYVDETDVEVLVSMFGRQVSLRYGEKDLCVTHAYVSNNNARRRIDQLGHSAS
jgi:transcription antitermination factor NusG